MGTQSFFFFFASFSRFLASFSASFLRFLASFSASFSASLLRFSSSFSQSVFVPFGGLVVPGGTLAPGGCVEVDGGLVEGGEVVPVRPGTGTVALGGSAVPSVVGSEVVSTPSVPDKAVLADTYPLLFAFTRLYEPRVVSQEVALLPGLSAPVDLPVWHGKVGRAPRFSLAVLHNPIEDPPDPQPEVVLPDRPSYRTLWEEQTGSSRSEEKLGYAVLTPETGIKPERLMLAAVEVRARGLIPGLGDPQAISQRLTRDRQKGRNPEHLREDRVSIVTQLEGHRLEEQPRHINNFNTSGPHIQHQRFLWQEMPIIRSVRPSGARREMAWTVDVGMPGARPGPRASHGAPSPRTIGRAPCDRVACRGRWSRRASRLQARS